MATIFEDHPLPWSTGKQNKSSCEIVDANCRFVFSVRYSDASGNERPYKMAAFIMALMRGYDQEQLAEKFPSMNARDQIINDDLDSIGNPQTSAPDGSRSLAQITHNIMGRTIVSGLSKMSTAEIGPADISRSRARFEHQQKYRLGDARRQVEQPK